MNDKEIEQKIEELLNKNYVGKFDEDDLAGMVEHSWRQSLKEAILFGQFHMKQKVAKLLQETYGNDGQPALVLIESLDGSVEQRPALDTILKAINEL